VSTTRARAAQRLERPSLGVATVDRFTHGMVDFISRRSQAALLRTSLGQLVSWPRSSHAHTCLHQRGA
jgi:hypothetical protein